MVPPQDHRVGEASLHPPCGRPSHLVGPGLGSRGRLWTGAHRLLRKLLTFRAGCQTVVLAPCEERKAPQTSSGRAGPFPGAVGAGGCGGHLEGAGGVAGLSGRRPPGWSPLRGSVDGGGERTVLGLG